MPTKYARYYRTLTKGLKAKPRGLDVSFVHNVVYQFTPGKVVRRHGDNPAIGFMELTQLIAGVFDVDGIARVAPNARLELFTGQSAYGPRMGEQLERVVNELVNDKDSRRAVIMIAGLNETPETMPCTLSAQFQLVSSTRELVSTFTMRSSDAIWGLPYDMIQFGGLSLVVASCTMSDTGHMSGVINIANGHVYDSTRPSSESFDDRWTFELPDLGSVKDFRGWASDLLKSNPTRGEIEGAYNFRREDG